MDESRLKQHLTQVFGEDADEVVEHCLLTSQGSTYFVDKHGRSVRLKSYHPEHGTKDQGWKSLSDQTIYVPLNTAISLARYTQFTDDHSIVYHTELGEWYLIKHYDSGKQEVIEVIDCQSKPKVGYSPIEFFSGYVQGPLYSPRKIHIGNDIVSIG